MSQSASINQDPVCSIAQVKMKLRGLLGHASLTNQLHEYIALCATELEQVETLMEADPAVKKAKALALIDNALTETLFSHSS